MKECVIFSMALGFIAGALLVSNNSKAQHIVEKGYSHTQYTVL